MPLFSKKLRLSLAKEGQLDTTHEHSVTAMQHHSFALCCELSKVPSSAGSVSPAVSKPWQSSEVTAHPTTLNIIHQLGPTKAMITKTCNTTFI